jgi:hypothetical protein
MHFDEETREALRVESICQHCGQRPAAEGRARCGPCLTYVGDAVAKRQAELGSQGLCAKGCRSATRH